MEASDSNVSQFIKNHLVKVVRAIADHGRAVNFILPAEKIFSVRVMTPSETRAANIARAYGATLSKAQKRIARREVRRRAFIRQTFNNDIRNPCHYDLTINTARLSVKDTADTVIVSAC